MVRVGLDTGIVGKPLQEKKDSQRASLLVLGAETIYSPFALRSFTDTVFALLRSKGQADGQNGAVDTGDSGAESSKSGPGRPVCIVAAKKLYFGVGGSLDDFVDLAREMGATVTELREEAQGVRRGVVKVVLGEV